MKPKMMIVKYFDWAIIGVLALGLIVAVIFSFVLKDRTIREIEREIVRDEKKIRLVIEKPAADETAHVGRIETLDYIGGFRNRLDRLPVIGMLRDNPFRPPDEVFHSIIQLAKGQSQKIRLKGVQLVSLQSSPDVRQKVGTKIDYDREKEESQVEFVALDNGDALVKIGDNLGRVHKWRLVVRVVRTPPPPFPPVFVGVGVFPPFEYKDEETEKLVRVPACVLIRFRPRNPAAGSDEAGITTHAMIYRKVFDAPDMDYAPVHDGFLSPISTTQAQDIKDEITWRERIGAGMMAGERRGGAMVDVPRYEHDRPEMLPEAGEFRHERDDFERPDIRGGRERETTEAIPAGSYAYLDDTVDEGESYAYKIVTLSVAADRKPSRCKRPYVRAAPTIVPSIVQFAVVSAPADRATFEISRMDPEVGPQSERFSVIPGLKIGGIEEIRVPGRFPPRVKVDFSTNCIMVDTVSHVQSIEYRVKQSRKTGEITFDTRIKNEPRVLYITPQGSLRWKTKERRMVRPREGERGPRDRRDMIDERRGRPDEERAPAEMDRERRGVFGTR